VAQRRFELIEFLIAAVVQRRMIEPGDDRQQITLGE
jgi:hypothetical protein